MLRLTFSNSGRPKKMEADTGMLRGENKVVNLGGSSGDGNDSLDIRNAAGHPQGQSVNLTTCPDSVGQG